MGIGIIINTSDQLGAITAFQPHQTHTQQSTDTNAEFRIENQEPHKPYKSHKLHNKEYKIEWHTNFSTIFHESFLSKLSNQRSNAALQTLKSCMQKIQHTYNLSSHHESASKIDHIIQISDQKSFTGARIASTIAQAIKLSINANLYIIDAKKLYNFIDSQVKNTQITNDCMLIEVHSEADANANSNINTLLEHNSAQINSANELIEVFQYNLDHIHEKPSKIECNNRENTKSDHIHEKHTRPEHANLEHNTQYAAMYNTQLATHSTQSTGIIDKPNSTNATPNTSSTEDMNSTSTKKNIESNHSKNNSLQDTQTAIDNLDLLQKHIYAHLYTVKQENKDAFANQIAYFPSKYDL